MAVLHAVDDLLVEVGYAAMTMKGIAEAAGVGRQTVYRWWATKAEILVEACTEDARKRLSTPARPDAAADLLTYLKALDQFLRTDAAGLAYRALVGEAQHDPAVRELVANAEILAPTARAVLGRVRSTVPGVPGARLAVAQLTGPVIVQILLGPAPLGARQLRAHVDDLLIAWGGSGQG